MRGDTTETGPAARALSRVGQGAGGASGSAALVANGLGDAMLVRLPQTLVVQQVEGEVYMPVVTGRQVSLHSGAVLAAREAG